MRDTVIAGVGMTSFGKFIDRSFASLTSEAVSCAVWRDSNAQACLAGNDIEGWCSMTDCHPTTNHISTEGAVVSAPDAGQQQNRRRPRGAS